MNELPMPTRGPVEVVYNEDAPRPYFVTTKAANGQEVLLAVLPELTIGQTHTGRFGGTISGEAHANGILIAAAFNSAEACRVMGFDPIGCIEALPRLLDAARKTDDGAAGFRPATLAALAAARTRSQP